MKETKWSILSFLLCIFCPGIFLTGCGVSCFTDNYVVTNNVLQLDINCMKEIDKFTMECTTNETMKIQMAVMKGSIYMEVKEPDGDTLYAGNGNTVSDFTVTISEPGVYSIILKAPYGKGTVRIQRMNNTEEKHEKAI